MNMSVSDENSEADLTPKVLSRAAYLLKRMIIPLEWMATSRPTVRKLAAMQTALIQVHRITMPSLDIVPFPLTVRL